jgi:hypothetical protein
MCEKAQSIEPSQSEASVLRRIESPVAVAIPRRLFSYGLQRLSAVL